MPVNVLKKDNGTIISRTQIQEKTDRYFDYMTTELQAGKEIYVSNVIAKEDLVSLFEGKNYYGVKVLLVKENNTYQQAGTGMFIVPVIEGPDENQFINQLNETDKIIYESCPSKYCKLTSDKLSL